MKILMVIPYFVPAWSYGGPVQVCFLQSKYLTKQGHSVTVATTDTLDANNRINKLSETVDRVKIIRFKNVSNFLAKRVNGYLPLSFYNWLEQNIKEFDVIHCHDFFTYQNICVRLIAKKYSKKYIIQPHGSAVPQKSRGRVGIKTFFNNLWGRSLIKDAAYTICLTKLEQKNIKRYFSVSKTVLLPNMIESISHKKTINIRKKYNIPQDSKIILSLGRLHSIKGFDILLKAFSIYHTKQKDTYLFIAGPDEGELAHLKTQVEALKLSHFVFFTGLITGEEKKSLLAASDIFALLSRNEPFPVSVLEALESGLPVLLSTNIGIATEISQNKLGISVKLNNTSKIASALKKTFGLKSNDFGDKTTEYLKQFRPEKQIPKLIKLYQK